jgi:hypothetical protein
MTAYCFVPASARGEASLRGIGIMMRERRGIAVEFFDVND